jgi:hypothetical protein
MPSAATVTVIVSRLLINRFFLWDDQISRLPVAAFLHYIANSPRHKVARITQWWKLTAFGLISLLRVSKSSWFLILPVIIQIYSLCKSNLKMFLSVKQHLFYSQLSSVLDSAVQRLARETLSNVQQTSVCFRPRGTMYPLSTVHKRLTQKQRHFLGFITNSTTAFGLLNRFYGIISGG